MSTPPTPTRSRRRRTIDTALRERIEAAVDAMIAALDDLDAPDEECEDVDFGGEEGGSSDDEPMLGYTEFEARYGRYPDVQIDDGEPSLGWTAAEAARGRYALTQDCEHEHDGREPDEADLEPDMDGEPNLGASEPLEIPAGEQRLWGGKVSALTKAERASVYDQRYWCHGLGGDLESDGTEFEAGNADPAKAAAARERLQRARDADAADGDRFVQVKFCSRGRISNVRPLRPDEQRQWALAHRPTAPTRSPEVTASIPALSDPPAS